MATGVRDTSNLSARRYDMSDVVSLLNVARYPLLSILTNAGKDPASGKGKALKKAETTDSEFKWYEDDFGSREATIAASQTVDPDASTKTFDVASGQGARFRARDVIQFMQNKWTFEVTAVSGDTLTVGAELGGATGSGVDVSASVIWIIGNANEEGAGLRSLKSTAPVEKTGYTQIFRTPFGVTNTSKATQTLIRENDLDLQRRKAGIEHMVDIERAFLFGKKAKITTGTHPKRFTAGVINSITTYATASVDTQAEFEAAMETAFKYGNTEKWMLASAAFVTQINSWAQSKVQITQRETKFGLTILDYVTPHGTLHIVKHDLLTGTVYGNYGIILDMEALTYRYLSGRDTKLLTNRQANDEDQVIEEYLTEAGLQLEQESRHAILSKGAL